jgi:putative ABC transport system permease protein
MRTLFEDLRYGLRTLVKQPGFTLVAVLTLALGIAANATIFSMVSAFLLRPPSGHEPGRIAVVTSISPSQSFLPDTVPLSAPNYSAWRSANTVFSDMAASEDRMVSLASRGAPEALNAEAVSPNYFQVLGVTPALGRTFAVGEDRPGFDRLVILSYGLWERRFGSDPSVVGSTIRLNRETYTVVGVMPPDFRMLGYVPELWTPLFVDSNENEAARKHRSLTVLARLKPDATLQQAQVQFAALAQENQLRFPQTERGWGAAVRTLPDFLIYSFAIRSPLAVLMTGVAFVLLIACANVAGLLLARGAARRKELTIRVAMGASRSRIIRQLLTEALLLALCGGCAGLLLGAWGIRVIRANLTFNDAVGAVPVRLDENVLLFAFAASLSSAVLCGLLPALSSTRRDLNLGLRQQGRGDSAGPAQSRLRTVFVTGEIAFSLFLLVGAGLLVRGLLKLHNQELGFRPEHLLTAGIVLDEAHYQEDSARDRFLHDVLASLRQIPGAQSVAAASDLPSTGLPTVSVSIEGRPEPPPGQSLSARHVLVTPDYFKTTGVPLLRGRGFVASDKASAGRVAIVNQEFVNRFLRGQEALGSFIRTEAVAGSSPTPLEIIGVAGDVKTYSAETGVDPEVYESLLDRPASSFSLLVRTSEDPNALAPALRNSVADLDRELALHSLMSMPARIDHQEGGNPLFMRIVTSFALLALLLAAVGVYARIAYSTNQRTQEIGIRMALGASPSAVLRMILREGMAMAAIGVAVGLLMALPLPRLFDAMFSQSIDVHEPRLYLGVTFLILDVALLACWLPARRATGIDPMAALRHE